MTAQTEAGQEDRVPAPGEQRIALVTGGAGGIGSRIVSTLDNSGHRVVVLDRSAELSCDLISEEDTRAAAQKLLARHGRCDVLVHAANVSDLADLNTVDSATWRRVQAINVESVVWLCQELVPAMRERHFGRIAIIVSDTVLEPPAPMLLPYIVSKAALIGLTRSLAASLGADGITVNAVAPGLTPTAASRAVMPDEFFAAVRERQALPRTLTPDDTAAAVDFVVSDGAAALTGQTLVVDGGLVMR